MVMSGTRDLPEGEFLSHDVFMSRHNVPPMPDIDVVLKNVLKSACLSSHANGKKHPSCQPYGSNLVGGSSICLQVNQTTSFSVSASQQSLAVTQSPQRSSCRPCQLRVNAAVV